MNVIVHDKTLGVLTEKRTDPVRSFDVDIKNLSPRIWAIISGKDPEKYSGGVLEKGDFSNLDVESAVSHLNNALAPGDPVLITGRIYALLAHYHCQDQPYEVEKAMAKDWAEDMAGYPLWAVVNAARTWRRSHKWRPKIAEMRALVESYVFEVSKSKRLLEAYMTSTRHMSAVSRGESEHITGEEAWNIVKHSLTRILSPEIVECWLGKMTFLEETERKIILKANTKFVQNYVRMNFLSAIEYAYEKQMSVQKEIVIS